MQIYEKSRFGVWQQQQQSIVKVASPEPTLVPHT